MATDERIPQLDALPTREFVVPPGWRVILVPPSSTPAIPPVAESMADACLVDIIATLAEGRRRLTLPKLLAALEAAGHEYSERTVKRRLQQGIAGGSLSNRDDTDPPGYGLARW